MTTDEGAEVDDREVVLLEPEECLLLLGLEVVGRLASQPSPGEAPDVVPVNFVLQSGSPVFRTHDGTTLRRIAGELVSLQVDRLDWFHRVGWSVLVQGRAEIVVDGGVDGVGGADPDTWMPGAQPHLVRIVPERITGRRIELRQPPLDSAGYL